ncbi:hypothetical protein K435DRAFT_245261 [Dendrothele bispora CBS 962.96]|uniref:DUF6534 domain-containing protein n=1 Tax=Dendrothele bispora (strain CBS 962.96) TaxID=1314807 RepID=A0A4S8LPD2_DENBC|nr:hypothetical protein K435DRAFT_245261 [Dendrothele bispora CBS 962.96]
MLYMLEIIQIYKYFTRHWSDYPVFRIVVMIVFLVDTLCTMAECATFYIYSVVYWGEPQFLERILWPSPVFIITTTITATIVQVFMLYQHWELTKQKYVSIAIIPLILLSLAGALMLAASAIIFPQNFEQDQKALASFLWLVSSAVTDLAIMAALFIGHISTDKHKRHTRRIAILALKTGSITAMTAIATLISYNVRPRTNISAVFSFSIGRLYALTLLYNLNFPRGHTRQQSPTHNVETLNLSDRSTRTDDTVPSPPPSRIEPEGTKISTWTSISTQLYSESTGSDEWGIRVPTTKSTVLIEDRHSTRSAETREPAP